MKRVSVIICTKDRSKSLERAIDALARVEFNEPWEVIIVDNGSTDDTATVAERALQKIDAPARLVHEAKRGNGHGRNSAIAIAEGEIAFFTDDDCIVRADALTAVSKEFRDPSLGFVAGRINLYNPLDHLCCYFYAAKPIEFRSPWFLKPGYVQGSNMAFRMAPLKGAVGAFDPVFGAGARFAGEDLELAMRFLLHGWRGKYSPHVVVRHDHGRTEQDYVKLENFYDEGVGAYIEKLRREPRCGLVTSASIWMYLARLGWRSPASLRRVKAGQSAFDRLASE